ncbi:MAG: sugar ABC transporter substrate-binding protein [Treponema sp.]|jgi:multiple sugar transport system substrate-binding protein|nr:sugar ABC transporter substrate-binding protein [Treponema sp.]
MKKVLVLALVLAITVTFFTSCQKKEASAHGELRVLLANHPYGDLLKPLLPDFEKETGIRIIMEQLNETQLNQKLTTEFATGASTVDVFMTRPLQETLLFLKNNWLAPLDGYDFSDYPANTVDVGRKDGKPHVVPLIVEWQVLYYRKDLLEAAGLKVPANFEELENAARILNRDGVAGFASRGAASPGVTQLSSYIYNFGGRFIENGIAAFDTPAAVEAERFYGRLLGTYGPQGIGSMSWDQLMPIFQAGRLAMWTDASVFYGQLIDPEKTQIPAANIGVARLPRGPAADQPFIVVPWGMSVSSKTRNMDAAMKFLIWASSREMAKKGMLANITMARTSMWSDPSITSQVNPGLVDTMIHASANGYPLDRPFITSVVQARDLIGEIITESIATRGTSARLETLAKQKVNEVNELLKADGEYGTAK